MGSWNATCGVTQLPICYGDEVALFLLIDNAYVSSWDAKGHTYSNHYWTPRTIQLYGKYDDYGSYDIEDGWNLQFAIDCFQKDAVELPQEDEYRGFEVTKEKLKSWEFIMEAMHDDRILVDGYGGNRQIGLMAVHRHIFDEIVKIDFDHFMGPFNVTTIKESSRDYIRQIKEYLDKQLDDELMAKIGVDDSFFMFMPKRTLFGDSVEGVGESGSNSSKRYRSLLVNNLDNPELDDIVTEMSKYAMFNGMFCNMRKTWMPQAGAGSQSEEHEIYEVVNKAAAEVIKKRREYYDE